MKVLIESKLRLATSLAAIIISVYVISETYLRPSDWQESHKIILGFLKALEFGIYGVCSFVILLLLCDNARKPEERRRGIR